jgi:hypothetical protein
MQDSLAYWLAKQLGDAPDPMIGVLDEGLPAVRRLHELKASLTTRNSVPG